MTDSYPELPELRRSSQDGCDFCRFLHEIIVSVALEDLSINKMAGCTIFINISYSWASLYVDGQTESHEPQTGLDAMLITAKFSSDDIGGEKTTLRVVCHVEPVCGECLLRFAPRLRILKQLSILTAFRFGCSLSVVASEETLQPRVL